MPVNERIESKRSCVLLALIEPTKFQYFHTPFDVVVGDESSFEKYTDAAVGSSAFRTVFPESYEHRNYVESCDSKELYVVATAGVSEPGGISN
jgi:hypothetical protein